MSLIDYIPHKGAAKCEKCHENLTYVKHVEKKDRLSWIESLLGQ